MTLTILNLENAQIGDMVNEQLQVRLTYDVLHWRV